MSFAGTQLVYTMPRRQSTGERRQNAGHLDRVYLGSLLEVRVDNSRFHAGHFSTLAAALSAPARISARVRVRGRMSLVLRSWVVGGMGMSVHAFKTAAKRAAMPTAYSSSAPSVVSQNS